MSLPEQLRADPEQVPEQTSQQSVAEAKARGDETQEPQSFASDRRVEAD